MEGGAAGGAGFLTSGVTGTPALLRRSSSRFREGQSGSASLWAGMSHRTAVGLVHYLTTDTVHPATNAHDALDLLVAAEQYGLPRLGRLLSSRLMQELGHDNVCGLLGFAQAYAAATEGGPGAVVPVVSAAAAGGDGATGASSASGATGAAAAYALRMQNLRGGAWSSLQAACVSYILRHFASIQATESYGQLDEGIRAELQHMWEQGRHAYQYEATAATALTHPRNAS